MTKRESGWYRVWVHESAIPIIGIYDKQNDEWGFPYSDGTYSEDGFYKIDPKMVMTTSGQIVYNQPAEPTERAKAAVERYSNPDSWNVNEHDPLYNTKQEG